MSQGRISRGAQAPRELGELIAYSKALGTRSRMIQAAGGNTSLKCGDRMWIKASGLWLGRIEDASGFVAMDLPRLRAAMDDPSAGDAEMRACTCDHGTGARPSVEVPMHAALPQRYVIHSHSVDVLALCALTGGREAVAEALGDLDHVHLPYVKPGVPLSRRIAEAAAGGARVFVLANHGLIVAADELAEVDDLTEALHSRLPAAGTLRAVPPRPALDLGGTGYRWARDPLSHQIAHEPSWTQAMAAGSFAPDLLVFLGPHLPVLSPAETGRLARMAEAPLPMGAAAVIAGVGVALREDAFDGTEELLRCARDVLDAMPPGAEIAYLTEGEARELLDWDAEAYRQSLNAGGRA